MNTLEFLEIEPGAINKLYEAIGKASVNFPALPRTATGQVGKDRKFQYAPFHKVVACIKKPLAEQGVTFIQPLHTTEQGRVSLTLVVAGHGGAVTSTLTFKQDSDPKVFGADTTYHKRYQLTSFFCLEGDPDADDFEDDVIERKAIPAEEKTVTKSAANDKAETVAAKQETANSNTSTAVQNGSAGPATSGKTEDSSSDSLTTEAALKADKRPVGEKLTDAMKQLVWKMKDFDDFCREYPEEFPDFHSAARLPPDKQQRLYELLVIHKGVAPF